METKIIVSSGQYETCATVVRVKHCTLRGLLRRMRQLSKKHAVYGDNWQGWIPASVTIASTDDDWGKNDIIGGRWCNPAYGWLNLDDESDIDRLKSIVGIDN